MTRRSYRQHCALARALDLVGERWTLLIVRELLTGPRRYGELAANLPGMGTNLLAQRLRELVEANLTTHNGTHYALTQRGESLREAVLALARFGAADLHPRRRDDHWSPTWNPVAFEYAFDPVRARRTRAIVEFDIDGTRTQARMRDGTIETASERRWTPDATLTTDGQTFLDLAAGELDLETAESSGRLTIAGDRSLLHAGLRALGAG